ncbi:MAG: hypothetical protein JXB49_22935 [Bacteroidales bacterium]|nr:hypothetical protein [Bacteroidales bacterium]
MKTLIKIALIVFIGYIIFSIFSDKKEFADNKGHDNRTMLLKGEVTGNFSLLNQTVITIKELTTEEIYHILLANGQTPKIGTPVELTIRKYDIVKINDRSITLYKEISTEDEKGKPSQKVKSSDIALLKEKYVTFLPVLT